MENQPSLRTGAFDRICSNPQIHLVVVGMLSAAIIFSKLGGNGLANYDDCFYAQKAKEILQTGDWMTMHFNANPAWENPPFFMWLVALSFKLFGVSEFAAKFPSALFGVSTVLLVYVIAAKFYGRWAAFFSSFVLATTFIFTRYARHAMMDVTLSFFVSVAMYALILALERDSRFFLLWGLSIAVCMLIKSVLGLYPLVLTLCFLVFAKRWRVLFNRNLLAGCLIAILFGCLWYVDQYHKFGRQFIDAHFGWVIYTRGFNLEQQSWADHLTYIQDLFTYYWPWMPLFIIGLVMTGRNAWQGDRNAILLLLWSCLIVMIMSLMQSRVLWYIMPMFPAAAIVCGYAADRLLKERWKLLITKAVAGLTVIVAVILNVTPLQLESQRANDIRELTPYVRQFSSRGARIVAFRQDYYGLNNSLLFYSDVAAYPLYEDVAALSHAFETESLRVCIVPRSVLREVQDSVQNFHLVFESEELSLGVNRPVGSNISGN